MKIFTEDSGEEQKNPGIHLSLVQKQCVNQKIPFSLVRRRTWCVTRRVACVLYYRKQHSVSLLLSHMHTLTAITKNNFEKKKIYKK